MKLNTILAAVLGFLGLRLPIARGRMRTTDIAYNYRMGAGFPGDVNRFHPASIEPVLIDEDDPPELYGAALLVDSVTQGVRHFLAGDTAVDTIWGALVRPYPSQQASAVNYGATDFTAAVPPTSGVGDALRSGYIMVKLNAGVAAVKKGAPVFVWCAADSGDHLQGGWETEASGGNTAALDPEKYSYNGPADAAGVIELCVNI